MGLGIPLPPGLAAALLEPVAHPVLELVRRYARTHGPFTLREAADRFALDAEAVENALRQLAQEGRVLEGGFRPGGLHREWCDAEILRQIRRKSLAKLRREVEPVEQHTLARFLTHWQGLLAPRRTGLRISTRCSMRLKTCRARRCPHRCSNRRFCPRALPITRLLGSIR